MNREALDGGLRARLGGRHPVAAAAVISGGVATTTVLGAPQESDFEIGSISKGLNGMRCTGARERGEAAPETTPGDLLLGVGGSIAHVTLASVATHSSGLPGLAPGARVLRRTLRLWRSGTNPHGESLDELLEQSRDVTLVPDGAVLQSRLAAARTRPLGAPDGAMDPGGHCARGRHPLDRAACTAVVLLAATAVSVDRHGFALLRELEA